MFPTSNINHSSEPAVSAVFTPDLSICLSTGGWHKTAMEQLKKLGSALARHTGQEEGETISHLITRVSVQLQKGLSAMILNRIPSHAAPVVGGVQ